jgi:hypothetical protein
MRVIALALYCLTLAAAYGGNSAYNPMGQSAPSTAPSPVIKNHPDDTVFLCTPTPGYVLAAEHREVTRTERLLLSRQRDVAVAPKEELKATSRIRIKPIITAALDIRPVDE